MLEIAMGACREDPNISWRKRDSAASSMMVKEVVWEPQHSGDKEDNYTAAVSLKMAS